MITCGVREKPEPQQVTSPLESVAQVEEPPAAAETEVAVEIPLTAIGVLEDPVDP